MTVLFFVGAFSGLIEGKSFYSDEELLKKFPTSTPSTGSNITSINSEPGKYETVFYSLTTATELNKLEERPYSYIGRDNKIIDQAIYLSLGNSLVKYDLSTNQMVTLYEISENEAFFEIKYDQVKNVFYLTVYETSLQQPLDTHQKLLRLNPLTAQTEEIVSFYPGIYSVIKHLFTMGDTEVIYTEGGETCGGGGTIYTVQNGNKTVVKDYGIGCMEGSRLLGADVSTNSLVMAEAVLRENNRSKADSKRIFRKNVIDGSEQTIFTLPENGYYEQVLTADKKIVFKSDSGILVYDLTTGIQQSYPLEDDVLKEGYLNVVIKNQEHCLVGENYDEKKLVVYCLESGLKESFNYGILQLLSPHVFGYYDGHIIVSASKERK